MRVYLISSTGIEEGLQVFLKDRNLLWREQTPVTEADRLAEFAGRVCYMSFGDQQSDRTNKQYIGNLIFQGHESVLEHAHFTLLADGISRSLSHQLVRHRVGFGYSQLSQQYHDERDAQFAFPPELANDAGATREWTDATTHARQAYAALVWRLTNSGFGSHLIPKERLRAIRSIARGVLPNATETTLVMSGNARAWRHLLRLRGAIVGDVEMRRFCFQCWQILNLKAPAMFDDFEAVTDEMGEFVSPRINKALAFAKIDPDVAILYIWQKLESALATLRQHNEPARFITDVALVPRLLELGKITKSDAGLFDQLRSIRNAIAHTYSDKQTISVAEVVEYDQLVDALVRRLDQIQPDPEYADPE